MSKIEEIENKIRNLSPAELSAFREWFLEFDARVWDQQIEADATAGKLDQLADSAIEAHRRGESSEL